MGRYKNGKEIIIRSEKELNIEIIEIDDYRCKYKCLKCGAIKTTVIDSMIKLMRKSRSFHNEFCAKYYNDIIRNELGPKACKQFRDFYRYAHERCCNPNNKDYYRYKGKWLFDDYVDYYLGCYQIFKEAKNTYADCDLSIDRIENTKGYEKGNIRFVPMHINLRNRDNLYFPIMIVDIENKTIEEYDSVYDLARTKFDINKTTSIYESIQNNRLYLNKYKIFYTIKSVSTIENSKNE